jgi:hypothetical protein
MLMQINVIYDTNDQSFRNDIQAAVNIIDSLVVGDITVNIQVGDGDFNGTPLQNQNGALGGSNTYFWTDYSSLSSDLQASDPSFFNSSNLPTGTSVNGQSNFYISDAQERLFGILPASASSTDIDGYVGMGNGIPAGSARIATALHEIGHALGRIPGTELDLFRFTGVETRLFGSGLTAPPAYFSVDGGVTTIADWGQNSDPSDFRGPNSNPPSNLTPNDPFNEFGSSTPIVNLTAADLLVFQALGYNVRIPVNGTSSNDNFVAVSGYHTYDGAGGINTIDCSQAPSSVTVNLAVNAALNGFGQDDVLHNIQNIHGSQFNDALAGDGNNNTIIGGGDIITPTTGSFPTQAGQMGTEWHVVSAEDFTGDGKSDLLWVRNNSGDADVWTMNNGSLSSLVSIQGHMGPEWTSISGNIDFNHDGSADLLWAREATGDVAIWQMNGTSIGSFAIPSGHMGAAWQVSGVGDFNSDGFSDILWHDTSGDVAVWSMSGTTLGGYGISNGHIGTEWKVGAVADFSGDGRDEVMWVRNTGDVQTWTMNGSNVTGVTNTGHMGPSWAPAGVGDFNMDGKSDVVWVDSSTNNVQIWEMNGGAIASIVTPAGHMGLDWKLTTVGDFTGDGRPDLLWVNSAGQTFVWNIVGNGDVMTGGGGQDTFQFNGLNELGKVITDFSAGASGDILDLRNLETAVGYGGHNALSDGALRLIQNGSNTEVQVDTHYGEHHWTDVVTLQNVTAAALTHDNFLV